MELEFTADQEELRATVRTVLAAESSPAVVRELVEARVAGKPAAADGLWGHMVELGWPALTVPEDVGGLGFGTVELAVVTEELGRALAPGPLLPTLSQFVPALVALGSPEQRARFLAPVAANGAAGTLALAEETGSFDPAAVTATATPVAGGYELAGAKEAVFEVPAATEVVVVARTPGTTGDDGVGAFVVPAEALTPTPVVTLDATRLLSGLSLDGVTVDTDRALGAPGPATADALRGVVRTATVALAVETVGAAQRAFEISLQYAKEREQFGVPIGSFQAMKHKLADLFVLVERASALAYFAALTIAEDDDRATISTSMAKAAAGDAAQRMAKEGIQIHGGIGYTWEHDIQMYVRRLQSNTALFGGPSLHRQLVADGLGL